MSKKVQALRLTLGHAPLTWHVIDGLPGFYHSTHVSPLFEGAEEAVKAPGCSLEIVDATPAQVEKAEATQARLRGESLKALRAQVHQAEAAKVQTETAAVRGKE